jgi:cytochrome P450 family 628
MSCISSGKFKLTEAEFVEDALVLQIAGGDTTLSALVNCVYHLAAHQEIQNDLRKEIENVIPLGDSPRFSHIGELPFLEAFIKEVLRMHPPIPSGPVRETPPEGLRVNDVDIPGNIVITCPTWTIHHGTYLACGICKYSLTKELPRSTQLS